jgi:hypothetical protein
MCKPCNEWESLLGDLADDELDFVQAGTHEAARRRQLEAHMAECASCREKLLELRWVNRLLAESLQAAPTPPRLTLPGGSLKSRPKLQIGWARPALAATAVGLSAALLWSLNSDRSQPENLAQRNLQTHGTTQISSPETHSSEDARQWADLEAAIEREASAARLAASAEALADQATSNRYAVEALEFVAKTFPETRAGVDAAHRAESLADQQQEYQQ